jgi:hypothetical protein
VEVDKGRRQLAVLHQHTKKVSKVVVLKNNFFLNIFILFPNLWEYPIACLQPGGQSLGIAEKDGGNRTQDTRVESVGGRQCKVSVGDGQAPVLGIASVNDSFFNLFFKSDF